MYLHLRTPTHAFVNVKPQSISDVINTEEGHVCGVRLPKSAVVREEYLPFISKGFVSLKGEINPRCDPLPFKGTVGRMSLCC